MVKWVRCDVDIFKLTASAQSIYREVYDYAYSNFVNLVSKNNIKKNNFKILDCFSDTFKRLINVPRYTSSSLAFAMITTGHINVVFRKFAYSFMRRVTASSNSIVTVIVNSDVDHQSRCLDHQE